MKYPNYKYYDSAVGGWHNRNNVVYRLKGTQGKTDTGRTYFRFAEDYRDYWESNKSVKDYSGPCYADYIPIDIDRDSIPGAIETVQTFLKWFTVNFEMDQSEIPIWFSGSKGFHIAIPTSMLGDAVIPSADLPDRFRYFVSSLGNWDFDMTIYNANGLWRMENTINSKSGLYKIRIDDVMSLSEDLLIELATNPGRGTTLNELEDCSTNTTLEAVYNSYSPTVIESKYEKSNNGNKALELLKSGVGKGNRNTTGYKIAQSLRTAKTGKEIVRQTLLLWNHNNEPPMEEKEIDVIIKSVFSGKTANDDDDAIHIPSGVYDGTIYEACFDPKRKKGQYYFSTYKDGLVGESDGFIYNDIEYKPLDDPNNMVQHQVVLLPSKLVDYHSVEVLFRDIQDYIHKYVAVSKIYEKIASFYVLLSWIYDNFNVLPYLRARGEAGCGKTTFIRTVGSICYRPIFTAGATTTAPLFRMIEKYQGTLVLDEADFQNSDMHSQVVKILNCGYQKGLPVIRCDVGSRSMEPKCYRVFGPKIIATREGWKDRALESRCLTEDMEGKYRDDLVQIKENIFQKEALDLRNKLLMFRFKHYGKIEIDESLRDSSIEPRLNQISLPILSIIDDDEFRREVKQFMRVYNKATVADRQANLTGIIAEIVVRQYHTDTAGGKTYNNNQGISIKDITELAGDKMHEILVEHSHISNQEVGRIIRKYLHLNPSRSSLGMYIPYYQIELKYDYLCNRYGVDPKIPIEYTSDPEHPKNPLNGWFAPEDEDKDDDLPF